MFDRFTTQAIQLDYDQARQLAGRFRPMVPRRRSDPVPTQSGRRVHSGSLFATFEAFTPRTPNTTN